MTIRNLLTLFTLSVLTLLASAQPAPTGLTAAEQLQLLKSNRDLLDALLEQGTRLSDANTPLDRAAECQRSADRLAGELRTAVDRSDADRALEIGDLVEKVMVEGFVPNLEIARKHSRPGSPDYERVQTLHRDAFQSLDRLTAALPTDGPLSQSKRLVQTREKLAEASAKLGKPEER